MTIPGSTTPLPSLSQHNTSDAIRRYLGGWRGPLALAAVAIALGIAFNWKWLAAVGIAPLLLGALPCMAMCALGLCMNRMSGRSCETKPSSRTVSQPGSETPDPRQDAASSAGSSD